MKVAELYRALTPVGGVNEPKPATQNLPSGPKNSDFQKLLDGHLTLSQHAQTRIQARSIPWDAEMEKRISAGIDVANQKGSREALILADDVAVIANVRSRTIVTAMDRTQMKEQIFTNIDSAVLV